MKENNNQKIAYVSLCIFLMKISNGPFGKYIKLYEAWGNWRM